MYRTHTTKITGIPAIAAIIIASVILFFSGILILGLLLAGLTVLIGTAVARLLFGGRRRGGEKNPVRRNGTIDSLPFTEYEIEDSGSGKKIDS